MIGRRSLTGIKKGWDESILRSFKEQLAVASENKTPSPVHAT